MKDYLITITFVQDGKTIHKDLHSGECKSSVEAEQVLREWTENIDFPKMTDLLSYYIRPINFPKVPFE